MNLSVGKRPTNVGKHVAIRFSFIFKRCSNNEPANGYYMMLSVTIHSSMIQIIIPLCILETTAPFSLMVSKEGF